jgi:hypothetical protein
MKCIDNNAVTYVHYRLYRLKHSYLFLYLFFLFFLFFGVYLLSHFVAGQIICRLIL